MASYRYERDIRPEDLVQTPPRPLTPRERRANWWHYHWYYVALLLAALLAAGWYLQNRLTEVRPDHVVTVVGRVQPDEALLDELRARLEAVSADENGDGQVAVEVRGVWLDLAALREGGDLARLMESSEERLNADFYLGESMVFLVDDPAGLEQLYGCFRYLAGWRTSPCRRRTACWPACRPRRKGRGTWPAASPPARRKAPACPAGTDCGPRWRHKRKDVCMETLETSPLAALPAVRVLGRHTPDHPETLFWTAGGLEMLYTGSELRVEWEADYSTMEPWVSVELNGGWISRFALPKGRSRSCLFRGMTPGKAKHVRILKDSQAMFDDPAHMRRTGPSCPCRSQSCGSNSWGTASPAAKGPSARWRKRTGWGPSSRPRTTTPA